MLSNLLWFPWAQIGGGAPVAPPEDLGGGRLPGDLIEPRGRRRRTRREELLEEDDLITVLLDSL